MQGRSRHVISLHSVDISAQEESRWQTRHCLSRSESKFIIKIIKIQQSMHDIRAELYLHVACCLTVGRHPTNNYTVSVLLRTVWPSCTKNKRKTRPWRMHGWNAKNTTMACRLAKHNTLSTCLWRLAPIVAAAGDRCPSKRARQGRSWVKSSAARPSRKSVKRADVGSTALTHCHSMETGGYQGYACR